MNASRVLLGLEAVAEALLSTARRWCHMLRTRDRVVDKVRLKGRSCSCRRGPFDHLLHSEGLREGCDVVIDHGSNVKNPQRRQVSLDAVARVAPEIGFAETVHVKADLLQPFVERVLPRLRAPVILVTGDSDFPPVVAFEGLLDHPHILHWFVQNCDVPYRHPRLTRLPIGLDNPVFTRLEKRIGFLLAMLVGRTAFDPTLNRNDMGDQALLFQARAGLPLIREKALRVLCTFHQNGRLVANLEAIPERLEALRHLKEQACCWFAPRRLPQAACWRIHGDFAFEACPRGKGLDCFRTWEALALDTIPIVQASTLDPLYEDEGFPVVRVASYAEVTPENLRRWKADLQDAFTPEMRCRLTVDYWLSRIRAQQQLARGRSG